MPRVALYLSEYSPQDIDGLTIDRERVKRNELVHLANGAYHVNESPINNMKVSTALCDKDGNIRAMSIMKYDDIDIVPIEYQLSGYSINQSCMFEVDASPGDYICMVYKGDGIPDWTVMGAEGPVKNYCLAYDYVLPKVPVKWINADKFNLQPIYSDTSVADYMIAGQSWTIQITPKESYHTLGVLIDGEASHDNFSIIADGNSSILLQARGKQRLGDSFEIELIAINEDDISQTPVNITDLKAGTLQARLEEIVDPKYVMDLTVSGTLTDTDFYFMRDRMFSLQSLDIADTDILGHDYNPDNFIPYMAFSEKSSLKNVVLPKGLKGFHNNAFARTSLKEVFVPTSATQFGVNVFNSCGDIEKVTVAQSIPPTISWCVFAYSGRPDATLVVPAGCKGLYEAHPEWGQFGTIIEDNTLDASIDSVVTGNNAGFKLVNGTVTCDNVCHVYNMSGMEIGTGHHVTLPARGIYIIRTVNAVSKIVY